MKVLLLAPMSSVHERFNTANINALKAINCEIHLAANFQCNEHDMGYKKQVESEGIIVHDIPFQRHSLIKNILLIGEIKKVLLQEKFDVVHAHTETGGILTRLSMRACRTTKYIYTPHGMSFYKGSSKKSQLIYRPIEKWICSKMSANLAMNKEELEVLKQWNEKTAFYIHGIGLDVANIKNTVVDKNAKRSEFSITESAKLVMSTGELNENKNHKVVMDAISQIERDDIYYIICGEGDKRDELVKLANEKGLGDRLILTGYRYDVKEILKAADLFVFPSYHEGLPVSVMEAMASGLPVVCSEIRGNVDLIENGKGGFLCDPDDVSAWKKAIENLLSNEELSEKCSNINLEYIESFSYDCVFSETEKIYRNVLGE